jgi:tripartite-type tricarboxylate transporter receptor subunit TctC
MVTVNAFSITPSLIKNTPYDVVRDFSPIGKIATATYCFAVNPKVFPASNMNEAIARIRKNPGKYFFASPGNGTPHHIGMELIKLRLGLDLTHVPYKGFAGAMQDLVGGQVHMMFTLVHSAIPQARRAHQDPRRGGYAALAAIPRGAHLPRARDRLHGRRRCMVRSPRAGQAAGRARRQAERRCE